MQTYEFLAKPQNGVIAIPDNLVNHITANVRVILHNVGLDDGHEQTTARTDSEQRIARFRKAMQEASEAEYDMADADWDELENVRRKTNAGMSRSVDL